MKHFSRFFMVVFIFSFFVCASSTLFSAVKVGDEVNFSEETPHPYKSIKGLAWEKEFTWPGASYVSLHFTKFDLAPGDFVEVSSPSGQYVYTYEEKGKLVKGAHARYSEFWATHIPGETAIVRLYSNGGNPGYGFIIDKWAHGYEKEYMNALIQTMESDAQIEAICSSDDKQWAKCYEGTTMYTKSRAVARLLINGSSACTGWLLGSQGHLMTNNHCISTQTDAANTDYEFMGEGATCATDCSSWGGCPGTVEATSGTLIKTSAPYDYALILLPTNLTSQYGYLQLRNSLPTVGERIYIPQHAGAKGKEIAVESDSDGGYCEIYSLNQPACQTGGPNDIGYMADTEGGSSGSPVIAYSDNLVVALHHCANCPNRGVPIPNLITEIGSSLPADAIGNSTPQVPVANFTASKTAAFTGENIVFTDQSTNTPTSWSWTFTGGTPSTSTAQNPTVSYSAAGTYSVTLTATNSAGSNSITKTNYITITVLPAPVANFTASSTSIATGSSVTFTDTTTNNPTSWSWTFNGGTPATSTVRNPVVTYNTAGTYSVTLTATNAAGSNTLTRTNYITVTTNPYCTAASTNCTEEWIASVQIGTTTKTSGASNYSDFTSQTITLRRGTSVSYRLTPGFSGSSYTEYWRVYVDYNKNNVFTNTGEQVLSKSGTSYVSGSFTVPSTATLGTTRLRVVMKYGSAPTPCGSFTYGEVEDYTANITQ